jgi:4-oxalocrotonate tautomerase family enzyme
MPLVRIDLLRGRSERQRQAIGEAVYEALRSIGVPEDDRFQIISEHDSANFIFASSYLGLEHTESLIMVQITFNEGRSTEQKQALFKSIAEGIASSVDVRLEDVFVSLVEVKKENWSFGAGKAQYAERR